MIYTGIDIIEIDRVAGVLERYPRRFLEKVFTDRERAYSKGRAAQLAARFAAKEAVMKALGTGIRGVPWKSVEITRRPGSAPEVRLHGNAAQIAKRLNIARIAVSISHSRNYAVVSVVIEARERT